MSLTKIAGPSIGSQAVLSQTFRGLTLRTHPNADVANFKLLANCDECVMHDGALANTWSNIVMDSSASGENGIDTGTIQTSTWYEAYLIRKSGTGTKAGLLHRAKNYLKDAAEEGVDDSGLSLRYDSGYQRVAQSFTVSVAGAVPFVDVYVAKVGSPTGYGYFAIETDSAGRPSGTALATSDVINVSLYAAWTNRGWVRHIFRNPATLSVSTTYHLVWYATSTLSTSNYLNWRVKTTSSYANGKAQSYNGSVWADFAGGGDALFRIYVTQNDTALTLPTDYDQYCKIGYAYSNGSGHFVEFYQTDRTVRRTEAALATGFSTTTHNVLTELTAIVPPIPVILSHWTMVSNGVGNALYVYPGFSAALANAGLLYNESLVANRTMGLGADLMCEFQHVYLYVTGGSNSFGISGWRF